MILSRTTPCQVFDIRQPRWHDRKVLLVNYKVGTHNLITFKAKTLEGEFYISGEEVKKHPLETNGKINCYCVPIDRLEPLERG